MENNQSIINVLSVDMDYIMKPCINLYDDLAKLDNPQKVWDIINEVRSIDKHLAYDEGNLKFIFDIFTKKMFAMKNNSKVMFAINHDAILLELSKYEYKNNKFNVYNLDHHHDIHYSEGQAKEVDKYDSATISNWIWYLDKYHKIENYYWLRNENSENYKGQRLNGNFVEVFNPKQCDIDYVPMNVIFICNSPQWYPRKYDIYFDMLIKIYENYTGMNAEIIKRHYCEGSISRPLEY